jgi:hypothetical protein
MRDELGEMPLLVLGPAETPVLVRLCAYLIREVQVLSRYTFSGL